jgi:hypothetical protein
LLGGKLEIMRWIPGHEYYFVEGREVESSMQEHRISERTQRCRSWLEIVRIQKIHLDTSYHTILTNQHDQRGKKISAQGAELGLESYLLTLFCHETLRLDETSSFYSTYKREFFN